MMNDADMRALWILTADPGTWELRRTLEWLGEQCAALGLVEPAGPENTWRLTAAGQDAWRHFSANPPPDPYRVRADEEAGPAFLPEPAGLGGGTRSPRHAVQPLDIWRAAKVLVDQHGADAGVHAALRVDELAAAGDDTGRQVWRDILDAVAELQRVVPSEGEARH